MGTPRRGKKNARKAVARKLFEVFQYDVLVPTCTGVELMAGGRRKVVRPVIRNRKVLVTERKFPHIVEIVLPVNGLDVLVNREMVTFCRLRNIRPRFGRRRKRTGQDYCRWCFSDRAAADAFRERFGGVSV